MSLTIITDCVKSAAKGVGQVIFQPSWMAGLLMCAGVLLASLSIGGVGCSMAFAGGLVSLVLITIFGISFNVKSVKDGILGFNAVLLGCAVFTFLSPSIEAWTLLIGGTLLTYPLKRFLDTILKNGSYTFPFVMATWSILIIAHTADMPRQIMPAFGMPGDGNITVAIGVGVLKGISEIFLADSWIGGILILLGLCVSNIKAAIWALIGSSIGMLFAYLFGCNHLDIFAGIWGYSPALTAVAVGTVLPQTKYTTAIAFLGIVVTFTVQYFTSDIMARYGLPVLTMPFCVATCICSYLVTKICSKSHQI